jgi:hypothetical protein
MFQTEVNANLSVSEEAVAAEEDPLVVQLREVLKQAATKKESSGTDIMVWNSMH